MISLLDLNVLVALAWPSHIHHESAHAWFENASLHGWATCPLTQSGFVRVSSNPKIISDAVSPAEAQAALREIVELPRHEFWIDDLSFAHLEEVAPLRLLGYRQVTDAHLLALAIRRGGRLATFDSGIQSLLPADEAKNSIEFLG